VLTIRPERLTALGVRPGALVLDAGAGFGRHAFELARRGGRVVALDHAADEVTTTKGTFAAMVEAGEIPAERYAGVLRGDATKLPFASASFDVVITSEVLEHITDDTAAIAELVRVLRPGGVFAATVPTWWPEKINWMLSDEYHAPAAPGGHVRIYSATELKAKLRAAGLRLAGSHHAHALHSPYWWLKCAVGVHDEDHPLVRRYRRFLEWDIVARPRVTRIAERVLSPVLGKSLVLYAIKPAAHDERVVGA
jgi:SAM-dependent methyltransferase